MKSLHFLIARMPQLKFVLVGLEKLVVLYLVIRYLCYVAGRYFNLVSRLYFFF